MKLILNSKHVATSESHYKGPLLQIAFGAACVGMGIFNGYRLFEPYLKGVNYGDFSEGPLAIATGGLLSSGFIMIREGIRDF